MSVQFVGADDGCIRISYIPTYNLGQPSQAEILDFVDRSERQAISASVQLLCGKLQTAESAEKC